MTKDGFRVFYKRLFECIVKSSQTCYVEVGKEDLAELSWR